MPSTIMTLLHLFEDQSIVHRLRGEIQATYGQCSAAEFDIQHLSSMPLLHSIYAETLRLHSTSYTVLSALDKDVPLGRWLLPRGGIGLISPQICHMDPNFWNTRRGTRPLQSFWAERFITDPCDPSSGPILPGIAAAQRAQKKIPIDSDTKPYVSMEGLEGAYVPYAGKSHAPIAPQLQCLVFNLLTQLMHRGPTHLPRSLPSAEGDHILMRSVCFRA